MPRELPNGYVEFTMDDDADEVLGTLAELADMLSRHPDLSPADCFVCHQMACTARGLQVSRLLAAKKAKPDHTA